MTHLQVCLEEAILYTRQSEKQLKEASFEGAADTAVIEEPRGNYNLDSPRL